MKNEVNKIFARSDCPPGDILKRYHAKELSSIEQRKLELHLASCEACSDELEGMQYYNHNSELIKATNELKLKIKSKLGTESKSRTIPIFFRIAAAILILFVASGVVYFVVYSDKMIQKNDLAQNTAVEKIEDKKITISEKETPSAAESTIAEEPVTIVGEQRKSDKMLSQKESAPQKSQDLLLESSVTTLNKSGLLADTKKGKKTVSDGVVATMSGSASGKGAVQQTIVVADAMIKADEQMPVSVHSAAVSGGLKQAETDADKSIVAENKVIAKTDIKTTKNERVSSDLAANEQTNSNDETITYAASEKDLKKKSKIESVSKKEEESSKTATDSRTKNQEKDRARADEESRKKLPSETNLKSKSATPGKDNSGNAANELTERNSSVYNNAMDKYNAGKYGEAILLFQEILKLENTVFAEDAKWYIALSQLKINNVDAARTSLDEIIIKGGKHKSEAKKKRAEIK